MKTKIITLLVLFLFAAVTMMAMDKSALKGLKKQENKKGDVTVVKYKSKKTPVKNFYVGSGLRDHDNSLFYLYIGIKDEKEAFLRMYVQVEPTTDWIKFNKIIITADDQTFEREFTIERLNSTMALKGQMIEFYDEEVMPHEVQIFEKVSNAKDVNIRFKGENSQQDYELKDKYKEAIKDILEAWKKLGVEL